MNEIKGLFEVGSSQIIDGRIIVGEDHRMKLTEVVLQLFLRHDMGNPLALFDAVQAAGQVIDVEPSGGLSTTTRFMTPIWS